MSGEINIHPLELEEIEACADLLLRNSSETPWTSTGIFTYFLREDTVLLAAGEDGAEPAGFAALLCAPPESDILDIAVDLPRRRQGIGGQLLDALLEAGRARGITTFYLEVRAGNVPARSLYEKKGFEQIGYRKNYYTDPLEDAVVMRCEYA